MTKLLCVIAMSLLTHGRIGVTLLVETVVNQHWAFITSQNWHQKSTIQSAATVFYIHMALKHVNSLKQQKG